MPWLMKAEPDSRIVKGRDVKFSVDDFEKIGVSPWDGVRSHEAKKIMKEKMKIGDKVLFYHSNTKEPGVYALAEVVKEGYPDHTAWDPEHPYFDPKTNKEEPTWYMVSVKYLSRLPHPPSLALVKYLASSSTIPDEVSYIGEGGYQAVKEMQLVNRGRLSVQPVTEEAYEAVVQLGTQGGWRGLVIKPGKAKAKAAKVKDEATDETVKKGPAAKKEKIKKATVKKEAVGDEKPEEKIITASKKRDSIKAEVIKEEPTEGTRRSKRVKVER